MINAFIKGQELKLMHPIIASDTVNYLELTAHFQTSDWRSLDEIYAIFEKDGQTPYEVKLDHFNMITKDKGLNLESGVYKVHFVGNTLDEGVPNPRITTIQADLVVKKSGVQNGNPFPSVTPTERDRIIAMIGDLEKLETNEKNNLVKAINEVLKNGGDGSGSNLMIVEIDAAAEKANYSSTEIANFAKTGTVVGKLINYEELFDSVLLIYFGTSDGLSLFGLSIGNLTFLASVAENKDALATIDIPQDKNYIRFINGNSGDEYGNIELTAESVGAISEEKANEIINDIFQEKIESGELKGDPGETPIKGIDYFTPEDVTEIASKVLEELPNGDEVGY